VASTVNGEPNPSVIYQFHLPAIISVEIDLAVVSTIPAPPNVATAALWGPRYSMVDAWRGLASLGVVIAHLGFKLHAHDGQSYEEFRVLRQAPAR
jgi:hypothetical protein